MKHLTPNANIRNIAIIAHVDHGKTTLVDFMLRQSGVFKAHQELSDRVMDRMDLERERGITIAAKNCAMYWRDVKINIVDTPGHADFGGEVERALAMVDGAVLLVDAAEGPLPQTRFVLKKALEMNLRILVVINKIDRGDARPQEVLNAIFDLFCDLDADETQVEFPVLYAIGREGIAKKSMDDPSMDLTPLFDAILDEVPPPMHDPAKPFQMRVGDLDYSDFLGRLAVGRIHHGQAHCNDQLACIDIDGRVTPLRVAKLQTYHGVGIKQVETAEPGDIVILAGIDNVAIGDTICTADAPHALTRITIDEPTVSMRFAANTSPLSGKEGKHVQANKIRDWLRKEALRNVAIRVEDSPEGDSYIVKGRGEFQMAIVIERMRREGFELTVGRPQVIYHEKDGKRTEPIEHLCVDCGEEFLGIVTEKLSRRKGRMVNMANHHTGRIRMEFSIPTRGLIGYRSEFLTDTKGTGIMHSYIEGYEPLRGEITSRLTGSLVADRGGVAVGFALSNLEPRGTMFVAPGDPVYEGMIVGEHNRDNDLDVNATKEKKLTNMRASNKDDALQLTPVVPMTLERAIEFIRDDEQVEATPKSVRLRKAILPANKR
ncbi:MAG: translational GTPase TypA [bacterium]|nr:translational GTPase TypA [bacterium]